MNRAKPKTQKKMTRKLIVLLRVDIIFFSNYL